MLTPDELAAIRERCNYLASHVDVTEAELNWWPILVDEIDALKAHAEELQGEVKRLREALKPFAEAKRFSCAPACYVKVDVEDDLIILDDSVERSSRTIHHAFNGASAALQQMAKQAIGEEER